MNDECRTLTNLLILLILSIQQIVFKLRILLHYSTAPLLHHSTTPFSPHSPGVVKGSNGRESANT